MGCLVAAYRSTPHESTGLTPNLLMLGHEAQLPAEVMFGSCTVEGDITSYGEYVGKLKAKMQHAHDIAQKHLHATSRQQKEQYDGKMLLNCFKPGSYVWCLNEQWNVGENAKLYLPYLGPLCSSQEAVRPWFSNSGHATYEPSVGPPQQVAQRGQSSSTEVRLKVAMSAAVTPEINNAVYYRSLNVGLASS